MGALVQTNSSGFVSFKRAKGLPAPLLPVSVDIALARETRAFSPHLTLARFDPPRPVEELHAAIEKLGPLEFGSATAGEFYLYQSVLKRGGSEYTRLANFPFSGGKRD